MTFFGIDKHKQGGYASIFCPSFFWYFKMSRPASQNTLKWSRWRIYAKKILHLYTLSLM